MKQKTLDKIIKFSGIGLHSGISVDISFLPSNSNGIVFRKNNVDIRASYSNVFDTNLGTNILENNEKILTIEHLMASLWACNIDNLIIEINSNEIPIMDGSSIIFIDELNKSNLRELDNNKKFLKILKKVEFRDGDKFISIEPYDSFFVDITVEYNYGSIGKQNYLFNGNKDTFINEISLARTFCHEKEISYMRSVGLAKGGNLDNAMVFNEENILNNDGFRCKNEVVKHKLLDCIGDLYTSGYDIIGKVISNKGGHTLNNILLKKLFENSDNYTFIE